MESENREEAGFVLLPGVSGGGVLVRRGQVVGARPNGPNQGAVVYTAAGPSLYTSLTTQQLGGLLNAQVIEGAR